MFPLSETCSLPGSAIAGAEAGAGVLVAAGAGVLAGADVGTGVLVVAGAGVMICVFSSVKATKGISFSEA